MSGGKARILVVEDEFIVATDLKTMLEGLGYEVPATAATADEAVTRAARLRPDLCLMDIFLKGEGDGITAAATLKDALRIPVIYLTSYADRDTLDRAKLTEPMAYVMKPFDRKDLQTTIEMALYKAGVDRKLRESEEWLTTILRTIDDAVITIDRETRISFMNEKAARRDSAASDARERRPVAEILAVLGDGGRDVTAEVIGRVLRSGKTETGINHVARFRGAEEIPVDWEIDPIRAESGEVDGAVIVLHDITERKNAERVMAESTRMAALGEMASCIAHEINNPLTVIHLNASELGRRLRANDVDPSFVASSIEKIESHSTRVVKIINALRSLSRDSEKDPFEKVRLSKMIAETEELCRERFGKDGVLLEVGELGKDVEIECRESQICQVLINLLNNACDAIAGLPEKWVRVGASDLGETVAVSVEDSGRGVDPGALAKIMTPFFTTKPSGKGTGLGLSISLKICREHGGTLSVDPSSAHTRFVFTLPKARLRRP